jgi:hypothetical protein
VAATIIIPKYGGKPGEGFSKAEKLKSVEWRGRRTDGSQSAASMICDLADNRTAILLCSFCRTNFNFRRNKYRVQYIPDPTGRTDGYIANGRCDACHQPTENTGGGKLYIAEEYWEQVSQDPQAARIAARNAWHQKRTWRERFFRR